MIFGDIAVAEAEGAILAHAVRLNDSDGRRTVFKKGRVLSTDDVALLAGAGHETVIAARLAEDDVAEDEAAAELANAVAGPGLSVAAPFTGRCNLIADADGIVLVDRARIDAINAIDEAITIATLPAYDAATTRQMAATIKIIPFAVPRADLDRAIAAAEGADPAVRLAPYRPLTAALVQTTLEGMKPAIFDNTERVTDDRLASVGGSLGHTSRCAHDTAALADAIAAALKTGPDALFIAGASAIVDRQDVLPAGIEAAGGRVDHFGMPVDPGNLLLIGAIPHGDSEVPVIGLPGCARSPKLNGFDWVLQRVAARVPVTRADIMAMGVGGLLTEIPSRPQPRAEDTRARSMVQRAPNVTAIVLAAGQSRRMGATNKMLVDIDGAPMVRRAVETALASKAQSVLVVTGHERERVEAALEGLDVAFVHNPDHADGLSTSLRTGIGEMPDEVDAALVCLGDMPQVTAGDLDRLIAAFNPVEGRTICVPTYRGKRGNPVLWGRRFFPELKGVAGDVGAKHLIGDFAELVCEVAMPSTGVLTDVDTPAALAALNKSA